MPNRVSDMTHLPISAPMFAVLQTLAALLLGLPWWVVLGCLLLGAPVFVLVSYIVCTMIYPCSPQEELSRE